MQEYYFEVRGFHPGKDRAGIQRTIDKLILQKRTGINCDCHLASSQSETFCNSKTTFALLLVPFPPRATPLPPTLDPAHVLHEARHVEGFAIHTGGAAVHEALHVVIECVPCETRRQRGVRESGEGEELGSGMRARG